MTEVVAMLYFPLSSSRRASCGCMGSVLGIVELERPTRCLLFALVSVEDGSVPGMSTSATGLFAPPPVLGGVQLDEAAAACIVAVGLTPSGQLDGQFVVRRCVGWL